jgi:hypothetical protein
MTKTDVPVEDARKLLAVAPTETATSTDFLTQHIAAEAAKNPAEAAEERRAIDLLLGRIAEITRCFLENSVKKRHSRRSRQASKGRRACVPCTST